MQRSRIMVLGLLICVAFGAIATRLTYLQAFDWRSHQERSETRRRAIRFDPAPRGSLLDRHGRVLAEDVPAHQIVYTLRDIDPAPLIAKRLANLLHLYSTGDDFPHDVETLKEAVKSLRSNYRPLFARDQPLVPHAWVRGLPHRVAEQVRGRIRRRPESYRGIQVELDGDDSRVMVQPEELFAGELAVRRVARALDKDPQRWIEQIEDQYQRALEADLNRVEREYEFAGRIRVLDTGIPFSLVVAMTYQPELYRGLWIQERRDRHYPSASALAQLVGYVGALPPATVRNLIDQQRLIDRRTSIDDIRTFRVLRQDSYMSGDWVGRFGLERLLEQRLRGQAGARIVEVDGRGRTRGAPLEEAPPIAGENVTLTLDLELCRQAERLLIDRGTIAGSVLIADVRDGSVLASCSYPSFHPETLGKDWQRISAIGKLGPLWNRPARAELPPGSTFKLVLALGALADGVLDPTQKVICNHGYRVGNHSFGCQNNRYGEELDLRAALAKSCNVYFYQLGTEVLQLHGIQRWASFFGFGHSVQADVSSERSGTLPTASPPSASIGQGFTATPLQLLRLVSGIANRGSFPRPRFIRDTPVHFDQLSLPDFAWQQVIGGMVGAVEFGTAHKPEIGLSRFDVAVKTGTAQAGQTQRDDDDIAWIVGFAPVEAPRIAFVVEIEYTPLHGGDAAGPVVAALLQSLIDQGYLAPKGD